MINIAIITRYDAIFYTGGQPIDEKILKKHLLSYGSYVSTAPEYLVSDTLGYISGSLFSGCIRVRLLLQVNVIFILLIKNFNSLENILKSIRL